MLVDEFDYELPEELIAQTPLVNREDSRLLVVDPVRQTTAHDVFRSIGQYLHSGDVLVFNNSRVLPARLYGTKISTGAKVELLLTRRKTDAEWEALVKPAKRLRVGARIVFTNSGISERCEAPTNEDVGYPEGREWAEIVEELPDGIRRLRFHVEGSMESFLHRVGTVPLPPYIHEPLSEPDRYQTVYAKPLGSVAAPTAGLHFTERLLHSLEESGVELHYVTLHVGLGTFRPVQVDTVEEHVMHSEYYEISPDTATAIERARQEGRRIVAVGTTAMRTLESAARTGKLLPGSEETDIFIYPGYKFKIVDALITNFHLPKSTLFMLVCAMMGTDFAKRVYAEAVAQRYRFFSFGDAMLISCRGETVDSSGSL